MLLRGGAEKQNAHRHMDRLAKDLHLLACGLGLVILSLPGEQLLEAIRQGLLSEPGPFLCPAEHCRLHKNSQKSGRSCEWIFKNLFRIRTVRSQNILYTRAGDGSGPMSKRTGKMSQAIRKDDPMDQNTPQSLVLPRIERLKVQNFRALHQVKFTNLTPLTVLLGPNGSGKSTVFDVFAFLSECFESGLRRAWEKRGRARELKSRGGEGPILIEVAYREQSGKPKERSPLITYHLEVDEKNGRPTVVREWLRWKRGAHGQPFNFLDYADGVGRVVSGELPDTQDKRIEVPLSSSDTLAVNALGQLAENPRVVALRNFIMGWHVSYLSSEDARVQPEAGPQERLSKTGDNLANVIQYLSEEHSEDMELIFRKLQERIPKVKAVTTDPMPDGRLLLQIKDAPFEKPTMARFASDGTLKMLAYLVLLHDPSPPPFIGIEEPENFLHPRLLHGLAAEYRKASGSTQVLVTTHSPYFLDALQPKEVWVLWRDKDGYTQCHCLGQNKRVKAFMDAGAQLGDLWMEGHFEVGDPLTRSGMPVQEEGGD